VQYLKENPDYHNPAFNTKFGAYSEGCGLENVLMSWGHDDYMYLVYTPSFIAIAVASKCSSILALHLLCSLKLFCPCSFQVAKENKSTLPSAGLFIIRYHSFYRKHALLSHT
jgi:inositol oxygenase